MGEIRVSCSASVVLDFDSINCWREDGHDGPHMDIAEGGDIAWMPWADYEEALKQI